MVEMFGLNRPLPTMIVARPNLKMRSSGIAIMNRPAAMITAPSRIDRW